MYNNPNEVPQTDYVKFAQASDPQLQAINARSNARAPRNPAATPQQLTGRPHQMNPITIYEREVPHLGPVLHVRIQPPGEDLNIVDRPLSSADLTNPQVIAAHNAYLAGKSQRPEGSPLDLLGIHPQHTKQLEANGIYTLEQLDGASDTADQTITKIGLNPFELRRRARHFLNYQRSQQLLDEKDAEIARLQAQLAQLKPKREKPRID